MPQSCRSAGNPQGMLRGGGEDGRQTGQPDERCDRVHEVLQMWWRGCGFERPQESDAGAWLRGIWGIKKLDEWGLVG